MKCAVITTLMIAMAASACAGARLEEQYANGTCNFLRAVAPGESDLGQAWNQRMQVARDDGLDLDIYVAAVMDACPDVAVRAQDQSDTTAQARD